MARTLRSLSAGVLAIGLVVAGCGDDDGGSATNVGEGNVTTSSSATGSQTTAQGAAGSDCNIEGGVTTPPEHQVVLTLNEWDIIKPSNEPKAGTISFIAENAGKEPHELVIVKGETAEALPTTADGAMDEDKLPEGALIGEIEPFASGQLCKGVFTLAAGDYVLLCNIVETEPSGEVESHFKEGMHTPFTVS